MARRDDNAVVVVPPSIWIQLRQCLWGAHGIRQRGVYDMRRQIRIITFDRPDYLRCCLEHLARVRKLADFEIVASVDGRTDGTHNDEVVSMLRDITSDVRIRTRQDCNAHVHLNFMEAAAEGVQWLLHLEDDVILAKDALEFCLAMEPCVSPPIGSLSLIGQQLSMPDAASQLRERITTSRFSAWGAYFSQFGLQYALKHWRLSWDADSVNAWDSLLVASGWNSLECVLPRAKNIGRRGRFCQSDEMYAASERLVWSDDIYTQGAFDDRSDNRLH